MKRQGRPRKVVWEICKVVGCSKTVESGAKGFCPTHYMAARRGRLDIVTGEATRPPKRILSYGEGARCLVSGCGNRPKGRGLCDKHYQQWESGRDLGLQVPERGHDKTSLSYASATCKVIGCSNRPVNKWMCSKHSQQRDAGIIDEEGNILRAPLPNGRRPLNFRKEISGYILVRAPKEHPGSRHDGSIYEHRLVMEKHLGRYLDSEEVVHHLNGVRSDNRIENLQLRRSREEHGHGHEQLVNADLALSLLEKLVNTGMTNANEYKKRLTSVCNRLTEL